MLNTRQLEASFKLNYFLVGNLSRRPVWEFAFGRRLYSFFNSIPIAVKVSACPGRCGSEHERGFIEL